MKHVIFNADDFGYSTGINRGIVEAHRRGVLTSASMMVTGHAVAEAVRLSAENPALAVGLHFDLTGEDEREFDFADGRAIKEEFAAQLDQFRTLFARDPSHVDSHRHVHRRFADLFEELTAPLAVPTRDDGKVKYIGHFYAQWEWRVSDLDKVSVGALIGLLETEVLEGWNEIGCHPGYPSPDFATGVYLAERPAEVETLCDARVRHAADDLGLRIAAYSDFRP